MTARSKLRLRASSADIAGKCPQSIVPITRDGLQVADESDSAARMGSAFHAMMAASIAGPSVATVDARAYADRHDVDAEDLQWLHSTGLQLWSTLERTHPDPQVELPMAYQDELVWLDATADLVSISKGEARVRVVDWKSGRIRSPNPCQMRAAAWCVANMPEGDGIDWFELTTVWVRERDIDRDVLSRQQLADWWRDYRHELIVNGDVYVPGDHCKYCNRRRTCPGRMEYLSAGVIAVRDGEPATMMSGQELRSPHVLQRVVDVIDIIKAAEQYRGELEELIRREIEANGPLQLDDDQELITEPTKRTSINPRTGWPIIQQWIGQDGLSRCVTIRNTSLRSEVYSVSPRGTKKTNHEQMMTELEAAGAVSVKETRPQLKRVKRCIKADREVLDTGTS